jgi:hypothetical protein
VRCDMGGSSEGLLPLREILGRRFRTPRRRSGRSGPKASGPRYVGETSERSSGAASATRTNHIQDSHCILPVTPAGMPHALCLTCPPSARHRRRVRSR